MKKGCSMIFRPPSPPQTTADLSSPTLTASVTE
jgi:7,8-dihydropterin-6-yl-methyl-4-(beta-D-ribofuranosyl)aminobenzene 5'-phosphate synthase